MLDYIFEAMQAHHSCTIHEECFVAALNQGDGACALHSLFGTPAENQAYLMKPGMRNHLFQVMPESLEASMISKMRSRIISVDHTI